MPTPREQLAALLKQSRVDAGYASHGALARKLLVSRPVVSKAENAVHPPPSDTVLAAWAKATGTDPAELTDLAGRCKSGTPDWFVPYSSAEAAATALRAWCPLLVPGLLQTQAYAHAVLSTGNYPPRQLAELLDTRMTRQRLLERIRFTAVVDHLVLARCMGSPAIMAEQCGHIATVADQPGVTVHVVPEGANIALWGAMDMALRDGVTTVNMMSLRDTATTEAGMITEATAAWEQVLGAALPKAESLAFVRDMESQWKTRQ